MIPSAVLLALLPCQEPAAHAAAELALVAEVSDERAAKRVRELVALGPRMGGTASGAKAADYLAEAFRAAGLEARVVEDPETWCHEETGWKLAARAAPLEGEEEGPTRELARAWPLGFSPSARGTATLSTEAREGAALLEARRSRRASGTTALALELVDGMNTSEGDYPRAAHLRAGTDNPHPVFGISAAEGAALRGWLAEGRAVTIEYALEAKIARARPRTTIATLPAREGAPPGYLLFCAHGDSDAGGPGANDNASGEAVVLEIAGAWAAAVKSGAVPAPAREVRFAIWGKEIHSTRAYLEERAPAEGELLGVVNFDQAGFGSGAEQLNVEPDDLPANEGLVRVLIEVLREYAGEEGFPPRWATNKSLGGTDSYVFSGSERFRAGGRPAVTVFTSAWGSPAEHPRTPGMPGESWSERDVVNVDYDAYYHSSGDTPANTTDKEPHNMGWCARVALIGAARWLERL